MASGNYQNYLRSSHWLKFREMKIADVGGICERCLSRPAVQVHHLTYKRVGHEKLEDTQAVCRRCHMKAHGLIDSPDTRFSAKAFYAISFLKITKPNRKLLLRKIWEQCGRRKVCFDELVESVRTTMTSDSFEKWVGMLQSDDRLERHDDTPPVDSHTVKQIVELDHEFNRIVKPHWFHSWGPGH